MFEIVFYGRGGQGVVTAAQILAQAAFFEGFYAQAFPRFGIERRGAPVSAFSRISKEPIEYRGSVKVADFAIVTDVMSISPETLFGALKPCGTAVLNSPLTVGQLDRFKKRADREDVRIFSVDATDISAKVFGETSIPITSIAMLGAFAGSSGLVSLEGINQALDEFFRPVLAKRNSEAASIAFQSVKG